MSPRVISILYYSCVDIRDATINRFIDSLSMIKKYLTIDMHCLISLIGNNYYNLTFPTNNIEPYKPMTPILKLL